MNGEQSGFVRWVNSLQMASLGSLVGEVRWTGVAILFAAIAAWLLTSHATEIPLTQVLADPKLSAAERALMVSSAVSIFLAHNTAAEAMRQVGLYVMIVIVSALTGKTVASFLQNKNVRETSREYIEAKERGRVQGEATAERPALAPLVAHADKVEQNVGTLAPVGTALAGDDEREPNAFRDDERGEQ